MQRKKILVLGAGQCQLPIIEQCKRMGHTVLVSSIPGPYPGFQAADTSYHVDVRNKEALLQIAQEERIDAVLTDQTDIPVATAAWIAEAMQLPGIGYECALRFTNKELMREACRRLGVATPEFCASDSLNSLTAWAQEVGYPIMIKPVDNQGSRGVRRVNSPAGLERAFNDAVPHTACGKIIAERCIPGREFAVLSFVIDGVVTPLIVGDRYDFNLSNRFIPRATIFPANLAGDQLSRLLETNARIITGLGQPFGIAYSELRIEESTQEIYLIEIAARGAGVFISSDIIPLASGVNVNGLLIRQCLGESVRIDSTQLKSAASGYTCFHLPKGIISLAPNIAEIMEVDGVHRVHLDGLRLGEETTTMQNKTQRLGPILMKATTRKELDEVHAQVRDTLRVRVRTSKGEHGPIWD